MAKKVVFSWKIPREDLMEDEQNPNEEFRKKYDSISMQNGKLIILRKSNAYRYNVYWDPGYMRDLSYFYECTISIKVNNMKVIHFKDGRTGEIRTLGEMDEGCEWSDYGMSNVFQRNDLEGSHFFIKIILRLPDEKKDGCGDN